MMKLLNLRFARAVLCVGLLPLLANAGPWDLVWSPEGNEIAVTGREEGALWVVEPETGGVRQVEVDLRRPTGVVWKADGLWVSDYAEGRVRLLEPDSGEQLRSFPIGRTGGQIALAGELLVVANYGRSQVEVYPQKYPADSDSFVVERYPVALATSPDGRYVLTGGLLPPGEATPDMAAEVVLFDLERRSVKAVFPLPDGSSNLRNFAISADGKLGLAVHTRGRTALPATQLDRGWISTNVISLVDLEAGARIATCVLDSPAKGAGDPWGVAFDSEGAVWISLAGTGELMWFDLPRFMRLLHGEEVLPPEKVWPKAYASGGTMPQSRTAAQRWAEIAGKPQLRSEFENNMALLGAIGLTRRFATGVSGLREIAIARGGNTLAALGYFDQTLNLFHLEAGSAVLEKRIQLAERPEQTPAFRGEHLFFDANVSFQGWMSCATCHHEARTDGLNWDLLNDGIGTPKNTKSMLDSAFTEPTTWTAAREDYLHSIGKGFFFLGYVPRGTEVEDVAAYFRSLEPEPSPYLQINDAGELLLSAAAQRGREVFTKAACNECHSGPYLTDQKTYNVGTGGRFDTPGLRELWRTAPYLHDGSADSVADVVERSADNRSHGFTNDLTPAERMDLVAYLLSL